MVSTQQKQLSLELQYEVVLRLLWERSHTLSPNYFQALIKFFFSILQEKMLFFLIKGREKSPNDCLMLHLRLFSNANKLGG